MPFEGPILCMFGNGFQCSECSGCSLVSRLVLILGSYVESWYLKFAFLYVLTETVGPEEGPSLCGVLRRMEVFTGVGSEVPSQDPRQEP